MYKIQPNNELYNDMLAIESAHWGQSLTVETRTKRPRYHPLIQAYTNQLISGNPGINWQTFVKEKYDHFKVGCSLGCGIGFIEEKLINLSLFDNLDLYDLSPGAIDKLVNRIETNNLDIKIKANVADINFIDLPENKYDFIMCNSILHHAVNIEHILTQVNRALKPDGIFLIWDFIGESRFQWSTEKINLINCHIDMLNASGFEMNHLASCAPEQLVQHSPFEAIRSSELHNIIKQIFGQNVVKEVAFTSVLAPSYGCHNFKDWEDPNLLRTLYHFIELDTLANQLPNLRPCNVFGIFNKSNISTLAVEPWDENKINKVFYTEPK